MRPPWFTDRWPSTRARLLHVGSLRGARAFAVVGGFACMLALVQAVHPFPSPLQAATVATQSSEPFDQPAVVGASPLHVRQAAYSLWAEPASTEVTLTSPSGRIYTTLPLCALIGRSRLPAGSTARTTMQSGGLHTRIRGADGQLLVDAVVRPASQSFTVSFAAALGPSPQLEPSFFTDGDHGIAMSTVEDGWSADPRASAASLAPSVSTVGRTAFAPPPFDVELRSTPGWFGVGLVQVPDASSMRIGRDGVVGIDYPLVHTRDDTDFGAGGPVDGMLRFPDFVVTFATDPVSGLRAYHDALASRHAIAVASPPGRRPAWWSQPLVDTWGEQMATGAQRSSPVFGAQWVRNFARDWRARYHVQHFTVVIDSRWQERIGDSMPDVVRFGGVSGMQSLIAALHAEGVHVLLWWPMWAHRIDVIPMSARQARLASPDHVIDPTAPDFASSMATTVGELLGSGPADLGADGLKLDWQYDIPDGLSRPDVTGALALYRYMRTIHAAAHAVRPDAMIDASAAAPQFAAVADTVRLYDAWNATVWDRRAGVVSAVDPDVLIDGDGWQADAADIIPHTVASTVYGTPAIYFSHTWMGGAAIAPWLSDELGDVVALSALKGQGHAVAVAGGEWAYLVGHRVTARTFAGERAIVVRSPTCTPTWQETVATTVSGRLVVPIDGARLLAAFDGTGRRIATSRAGSDVVLTAAHAGLTYQLTFIGGC